jgi:thiol-disulfide isomerase/thioredoxin
MIKSYFNKHNAIVVGASLLTIIIIFSLIGPKGITANFFRNNEGEATLYFFYGEGCGYCAKEKIFLEQLENEYSGLEIVRLEVWSNSTNSNLYQQFAQAYNIDANGVPGTFIGDKSWLGYDTSKGNEIRAQVEYCLANGCESLI